MWKLTREGNAKERKEEKYSPTAFERVHVYGYDSIVAPMGEEEGETV